MPCNLKPFQNSTHSSKGKGGQHKRVENKTSQNEKEIYTALGHQAEKL